MIPSLRGFKKKAEINLANHFEVCFSDDSGYLFSHSDMPLKNENNSDMCFIPGDFSYPLMVYIYLYITHRPSYT